METKGSLYDLSSATVQLESIEDLLRAAAVTDQTTDEIADHLLENAAVLAEGTLDERGPLAPISSGEMWVAGVTYRISEEARKAERSMPDMYLDVYESARPKVFFKATPDRTVGPNEGVGIRADSEWDVPEPELGVVLFEAEIVGYTIGNDMSSRSLEGQNPFYLRCIAAPITDDTDQSIAAISVACPVHRIDDERFYENHLEAVLGAANVIELERNYS